MVHLQSCEVVTCSKNALVAIAKIMWVGRAVTLDKQGWIPMGASESSKSDAPSPDISVVNR
jgi:hypothetical protein